MAISWVVYRINNLKGLVFQLVLDGIERHAFCFAHAWNRRANAIVDSIKSTALIDSGYSVRLEVGLLGVCGGAILAENLIGVFVIPLPRHFRLGSVINS